MRIPSESQLRVLDPLERDKAHYVAFAGKKRPDGGFSPGVYEGRFELIRAGRVIARRDVRAELR